MSRRAVIDVGTNSVKLLVAEVAGPEIRPLLEQSQQTRLGSGFYDTHRLRPAAIARTARAVAAFAATAAAWGVPQARVIATSAARDALNQTDLVTALRAAGGSPVEIVSGEQEADWVFQGVASDPALSGQALLIVDAGGGSSEFVLGQAQHAFFRQSFRLGTVRLWEQLKLSDPPRPAEWQHCQTLLRATLDHEVGPAISPALARVTPRPVQLVGTSGTTSILASIALGLPRFERDRIEAVQLDRDHVRRERQRLWGLTLAARKQLAGLPPDRADVILTGVAIYEAVMEQFDLPSLRVSTRGLRFAALMSR
jgi:exopolyphosphatase/guanosine-5'-triphosphate,3'-diphosphate pyrophosphatase